MSSSQESMYDSDDSRFHSKHSTCKSLSSSISKLSTELNKRNLKQNHKESDINNIKTYSDFKHYYDQADAQAPCSEAKLILGLITNNYQKTFKDIQNHPKLKLAPLNALDRELIKNFIRVKRQHLKRNINSVKNKEVSMLKKRLPADVMSIKNHKSVQKHRIQAPIQNAKQASQTQNEMTQLSQFIIHHFQDFDDGYQHSIIQKLNSALISDRDFYSQGVDFQIKHQQQHIIELFKKREIQCIEKELTNYSQSQILKFHLAACSIIKELSLEGQTLIHTFYPHLKHNVDTSIFDEAEKINLGVMASSINRHLKDINQPMTAGLVGLLLDLNSLQSLKSLTLPESILNFQQHLEKSGFSENEACMIVKFRENFLYEDCISTLRRVNKLYREDIIKMLSMTKVKQDPLSQIFELLGIFSQRRILLTMLAKRNHINLQLERLVVVLQSIKDYELDQLEQILACDETLWMRELSKLQSCTQSLKNQSQIECKSQEIWQEFLNSQNSDHKITLDEILKCSQQMEESCLDYKHSIYQSTIAAIVLNHLENTIQVQMPTASGKTWVQGLLACFWIQQGKKVVILVPDKILKMQTQKFLQPLGIQLQIETIENYYTTKRYYDILIIDEFDQITWKHPFYCHDGKLQGIWDIGLTRSYMFSATCDQGIQRVLAQVCIRPKILRFKSEYEQLHELRQDQGGDVIVCSSPEERLSRIESEIIECGQAVPFIIFCDEREKAIVKNKIEQICKLRVKIGISQDTLEEIESWQNGVLILTQDESFGYNTRFRTDASVLIACEITSESQYLQMRGRSSRSMGALQSKYFPVSNLPKQQILLRMKKISIERFDKLEQLVALIYKKRFSKMLIEAVNDAQKVHDVIESLEDLKQLIGESAYRKMSKS